MESGNPDRLDDILAWVRLHRLNHRKIPIRERQIIVEANSMFKDLQTI